MKYFYSLFIFIIFSIHSILSMDNNKSLQLFKFSRKTCNTMKKNIKGVKEKGDEFNLKNNNLHAIYAQLLQEVENKGVNHLLQSTEAGCCLAYRLTNLLQINLEYILNLNWMIKHQIDEQSFIKTANNIGAELLTIHSTLHLPYTIFTWENSFEREYEPNAEKIFKYNNDIDLNEGRKAVVANIILLHFIDQVAFLSEEIRKKNISYEDLLLQLLAFKENTK